MRKYSWFVWLLASGFWSYQLALRTLGGFTRIPITGGDVLHSSGSSLLDVTYYLGFCLFSFLAGAAIDRLGPRGIVSAGALMSGTGALLIGTNRLGVAATGEFLQSAGAAVALLGVIYVSSTFFSPTRMATLIGITQTIGLAGGFAGAFLARATVLREMTWSRFWMGMGLSGFFIAVTLFVFVPVKRTALLPESWRSNPVRGLGIIVKNPQSTMCALIAGLLFVPAAMLEMAWGIRFLQSESGFNYSHSVLLLLAFPSGWIIGCPLWGFCSDYFGRRKPWILSGGLVLLICLYWIIFGRLDTYLFALLGLAAGIASSASVLVYTVMRESNALSFAGAATGMLNFFSVSLSTIMFSVCGGRAGTVFASSGIPPEQNQGAPVFILYGVALAIVLTFGLKETGRHAQIAARMSERT